VFGAALVPLSQAVLLDINPREKVGQAMAIWGAGIMIGPILGPLLGGWLTDQLDWRWVFFINLPVGIVAFWGIARYLPESRPKAEKLDVFGFATLSLGIGLLQLFLDRGEQLDWFEQVFYGVHEDDKRRALKQIVRQRGITQAFVFVNSKLGCARLARSLEREGLRCTALHGDKSQDERLKALAAFKAGEPGYTRSASPRLNSRTSAK
jgi:DHA2 family multidrug resistance protein